MFRAFACGLVLCGAVSLLGCGGGGDKPQLATVSGQVTLDGNPLANVSVVFESENGQVSYGGTDSTGKYELSFRDGAKGAEVGKNTVRISTVLDHPEPPGYKDPIPAKYNADSTLSVEVQPGPNTHNFELQSK